MGSGLQDPSRQARESPKVIEAEESIRLRMPAPGLLPRGPDYFAYRMRRIRPGSGRRQFPGQYPGADQGEAGALPG